MAVHCVLLWYARGSIDVHLIVVLIILSVSYIVLQICFDDFCHISNSLCEQISKTLVDMQIDNNRIKEESDAAKFDLTNRVLQLEMALADAEEQKSRLGREVLAVRNRQEEAERERKEMANEFVNLKSINIALNSAHQKEVPAVVFMA